MGKRNWIVVLCLFKFLFCGAVFAGDDPFSDVSVTNVPTANGDGSEASPPPLPPLAAGSEILGTVDVGSSLNIRSGPWGDIIGTLTKGQKVAIVGQIGDWYKIKHNGKTAFVHSAYILRPGEEKKPFPRSGWINAALGVNVRRVPHGDVIGTLKDQSGVEILGVSGEYYKIKYGENEAFVPRSYVDANQPPVSPDSNKVTPANFIGYISANEGLNVRKSPWGAIDATLPYGIAVQVTGKIDDWYQISYNGKVRYVHANFVQKTRVDGPGSGKPDTTKPDSKPSGPLEKRIVAEAMNLVGSKRFRGKEVDYGNKACAQVVSTALANAGAMGSVVLNVRSIVSQLHQRGWKEVTVPPFKEGDVITWKTYDYTGDGVKDPDTHVGIMVKYDGGFKAMNNSSRLRTPRLSDPYSIGPVTRVLRKAS